MAQTCSKTIFSLLNSLLILLGITLIIISFYVYKKYQSGQIIIGIIILAMAILFIGLLGLIGSLKQSKCALLIYVFLMGLITIGFAALFFLVILRKTWFVDQIVDNYGKMVNNPKFLDNNDNLSPTRDFLAKLNCCGFHQSNEPKKIFDDIALCQTINGSQPLCNEKMQRDLEQNLETIVIILGIITGLSALATIVAIHLACTTSRY